MFIRLFKDLVRQSGGLKQPQRLFRIRLEIVSEGRVINSDAEKFILTSMRTRYIGNQWHTSETQQSVPPWPQ